MEKLLSAKEIARRLAISTRTFSRYKARLMALGLQAVKFGQHPKYRESSLDAVIKRLAELGGRL
jgi:predicted DNA-binding transcriptional regulator YafY